MNRIQNKGELGIKLFISVGVAIIIFFLFFYQTKLNNAFKFEHGAEHRESLYFSETTLITQDPYNHASSLVASNKKNDIKLAWVGGKIELDPNNKIYLSDIESNHNFVKTSFHPILNKFAVEQDEKRYLHGLGNPILVQYDQRLWLFFVTTFGGWATASINYTTSNDDGVTWSKAKFFKLSPFLNFSNSLKGAPIFFQDGTLGLPIYHELLKGKAKLLRINSQGHILSLQGLSSNGHAIQPAVVPINLKTAFVFMRAQSSLLKKIFINKSIDGAEHWNNFTASLLNNPDSAVSALKMAPNTILIAFNNSDSDRKSLDLAIIKYSKNQQKSICIIPFKKYTDNQPSAVLAYPYLIKVRDHYVMSYTDRSNISIVEFNQAWLEKKWKQCIPK